MRSCFGTGRGFAYNGLMSNNSKRGLRFSLFSFLLAVTVAALAVGLFLSAQRNAELQAINESLAAENLQHRNELGIFDVTDPARTHAIRVPAEREEPRQYRIYLPPGQVHTLHYQVNDIPEEGLPARPNSGSPLRPGHYLISVKLARGNDRKTGEPAPYGMVDLDVKTTQGTPHWSGGFGIGVSEQKNDWLLNKLTGNTAFSWQEIGRELQIFEPEEAVVLYRARAYTPVIRARRPDGKPTSWSSQEIAGDCDGFMVWIVSKPDSKAP